MPKTIEMIVSLKVPDTTAITALQTLQKIGFDEIKDVKRADYYKFLIEGNEEQFKNKISKVDILVNANKHTFNFSVKKDSAVKILVKSTKISEMRVSWEMSEREASSRKSLRTRSQLTKKLK